MTDNNKKFSFVSSSMPGDTFGVVRFRGNEGLSRIYRFEIELISKDNEPDLNELIQNPAKFTILREDGNISFSGILCEFEQMHQVGEYSFYKTVLVPRLWWLSRTMHNQVFIKKNLKEIIESVLKHGGLDENSFELKFDQDNKLYSSIDYVCQYNETHLNFLERWLENKGLYYYFEQTGQGEKLIITDSKIYHSFSDEGREMIYSPPSGLDDYSREEVIKSFSCRQQLIPGKVVLKDYNYEKPSLNIEASAETKSEGKGEVYLYGENFKTPEEGKILAEIRAEELKCREKTYHGESTIPYIKPGFKFNLNNHYRNSFNKIYLTTEAFHEGSQASFMLSGLSSGLSELEKSQFYLNTFTAIENNDDIQFRPERKTNKPKFSSTLNAKIDASGSGEYAELDEYGRYKVILPFDITCREGGKASAWIRMMQPYAGANQGMHFPLHKGTEVLLNFIDGDPDRPVIAGAIPNTDTKSPVSGANQTKSIIKTGRGLNESNDSQSEFFSYYKDNFIEFDDKDNNETIRIHSGNNLWLESSGSAIYDTGGPQQKDEVPEDLQPLWEKFYGDDPDFNPEGFFDYNKNSSELDSFKENVRKGTVQISKGDTFNTQDGNIYDFGGYWNYNLGNSYEENHMVQKYNGSNQPDKLVNDIDYEDEAEDINEGELNIRFPQDKANRGGPKYSKIEHLDEYGSNVWVTKNIKGASYEYSAESPSVEVNYKCDKYEYKYGGRTEEYKFTGDGGKLYEMTSEAGDTEEYIYDRESHNMSAYTSKSFDGGEKSGFEFVRCAQSTAAISLGAVAAFSLSADATAKLDISFSTSLNIDVTFSADIDIKTGVGLALNLDLRTGGAFELDESGKLEFNGIGFKARKQAKIKAEKATVKAEKLNARLDAMDVELKKPKIVVNKTNISLVKMSLSVKNSLHIQF
ncbi:MAG: type VI secretion system Vgr family protein [Thermodesulfobacteriota bacterium]